jgi:hypothetical protein
MSTWGDCFASSIGRIDKTNGFRDRYRRYGYDQVKSKVIIVLIDIYRLRKRDSCYSL